MSQGTGQGGGEGQGEARQRGAGTPARLWGEDQVAASCVRREAQGRSRSDTAELDWARRPFPLLLQHALSASPQYYPDGVTGSTSLHLTRSQSSLVHLIPIHTCFAIQCLVQTLTVHYKC